MLRNAPFCANLPASYLLTYFPETIQVQLVLWNGKGKRHAMILSSERFTHSNSSEVVFLLCRPSLQFILRAAPPPNDLSGKQSEEVGKLKREPKILNSAHHEQNRHKHSLYFFGWEYSWALQLLQLWKHELQIPVDYLRHIPAALPRDVSASIRPSA